MRIVQLDCPGSRLPFCIELEDDFPALKSKWFKAVPADCPYCGRPHQFLYRDLFVWSALHFPSDSELNTSIGREAIFNSNRQTPRKGSRRSTGTQV
jgi:hypothetical protein